MSDATARFQLPYLFAGQAQKEVYHNEALSRIDAGLHPSVEEAATSVPPPSPSPGQSWIVGPGATGLWAGREAQIAHYTIGGWRYLSAPPGMLAWNRSAGHWIHFDGTDWSNGSLPVAGLVVAGQQVVGARQPAIPSPSGGTTIDMEARAAIDLIIATLMSHGLTD